MSDVDDSAGSGGSSSGHPGAPRGQPVFNADAEAVIDAIERARQTPDGSADHKGMLPPLDLPSFGDTGDDCGNPIPESMYFCPSCSTVHQKPHVCNQYDCPLHWAHAVRRRVAGAKDAAGMAPQLDALRRYLYSCDNSDNDWYYHHLVFSLGKDRRLVAEDPMKRELETVREIMDELGIQGVVAYHPWAGNNEEHGDDRGEWKERIGKNTDWDSVRDELEARPHWHIIGVSPHVDVSITPEVNDATGAVIRRITGENSNKSITGRKEEDTDDNAMVRALTYSLSHAGIYETESGQRRLAAWMKGPDVHRISPLERNADRMKAIVYKEAKTVLGIDPPNMECDEQPEHVPRDRGAGDSRPVRSRPLDDVWGRSPTDDEQTIGAKVGNGIATGPPEPASPSNAGQLPKKSPESRGQLRSGGDGIGARSTSTTSSSTRSPTPPRADDRDVQDDEPDECGGRLRHISQAGEYLLDGDWNEQHEDDAIEDVETAYRSYITYMESKGLDPIEDRSTIPEFEGDRDPDTDGPPPG